MRRFLSLLVWLCLLPLVSPSFAVEPKEGRDLLDRLAVSDPRLRPAPAVQPIEEAGAAAAPGLLDGWSGFQQGQGGGWQGYVDRRNGLLGAAEGPGIPWIPGPGNQLSGAAAADLGALESAARAFLPRVASLLGVHPQELVLSRERSGRAGDQVWLVDFDVKRSGRIIEGARVVFRVSHGNLVQIGAENLPSPGQRAPAGESVRREDALATLAAHVGGFSAADTFLDGGSLHLLPVAIEAGQARGLALVWEFVFQRKKVTGTWRVRIDAVTGELLELVDTNRYARAQGGVYPVSYSATPETVLPMPFADLSSGGFTDSSGGYVYPGSPVTSHLSGPYVDIFDYCGLIELTSSGNGRLSFGQSGGTDCISAGVGGYGNTHATRTQFYHVNRIKEVARGWLPGNTWLQEPLQTIVNDPYNSCNAFWDGFAIAFARSGSGCGNTGEIAAVSLHELGHGLDANDGNDISPDFGTAEAYADITAALMLRDSCIGPGFFSSGTCDGPGDPCTTCSGVRDIDWAKHVSSTPHTVGNFTQPHCPDFGFYAGPCGREGHCEAQVITEAVWDLGARDLPGAGTNRAWAVAERLWYLSRPTSTSAFTCNTSTNPWTSDGCAVGSLWRTMRVFDDDDGNLANGTPHSCQLFAAFDRHGIACPGDPGASVCFSACTPPAAPALSATASQEQVQLAWSGGAGLVYDVYESEMGCSSGWRRVADDLDATSLLDTTVFFGRPHSYQVIAHAPGAEACASPPSACQTATPTGPPCVTPPPPAGVEAQVLGTDRIQVVWEAVAGAGDYQIWRATAAGGPFSQVATVASPLTVWMDTNLAMGTTYFYFVRSAFDACVSGDSAVASATTASCRTTTLYEHDFETGSGLLDWTAFDSTNDWRGIQTCPAHSGSRIFRFGGPGCDDVYQYNFYSTVLVRGDAGIQVPAGSVSTRLSFWHRWSFESCCDAGWMWVGVDGFMPLLVLSSEFLSGRPNSVNRFTGAQSSFIRSEIDLDRVCDRVRGGIGGCAGKKVRIGFSVETNQSGAASGWFLDDVQVTSCTLHNCTGVPQAVAAAAAGDHQIQVTWSDGSPGSSSFHVYRALGTCAEPGQFERVASQVAGLSYLDAPVSGGATWAYRVSGADASGLCESDLSACVETATTGACTVPPVFAGLAAATNSATATCGIDLSWPAATSPCGNGVTYDVYRSATSGFPPSAQSWIASGISGMSWHDADGLVDGTTYYYVVRAVDAGNGRSEGNFETRIAEPSGPILPWSLTETFEGAGGFDNPGWTHAALSGPADWVYSTGQVHSPTHSWLAPSQTFAAHRALASPSFGIQSGTTLSFWHTYELEHFYDGGTLEISTNGGASWMVLPDSVFTAGGFNTTLFGSTGNPIGGQRAWSGGPVGPMTQVTVDLSPWAGTRNAKLRWHAGDSFSVKYTGWYVDDVTIADAQQVTACETQEPEVPGQLDFFTLPPCRLVDTRGPASLGNVALFPLEERGFKAVGICGIPATARALAVNVTVTQPAGAGFVSLFPTGVSTPLTSTINFGPGQTRANNAIVALGSGTGAFGAKNGSGGTVHIVIDVTGYFE